MRVWGLLALIAALFAAGSSPAGVRAQTISVVASIDATGAPPGGSVTVTYSAHNDGPTQSPFSLALELSPGWTVGGAPAGCSRPDNWTIDCEFGSFAAGASTPTYSVTLTVDANAAIGSILNARAFAFPGGTSGGTIGGAVRSMQVIAPGAPPPPPPAPPTLAVSLKGSGAGVVASAPGGITCGPYCAANFAYGVTITLTATPAAGSVFAGWGDACAGAAAKPTCTFTISENTPVSAAFDPAPPPPTTTAPPPLPPPLPPCTVPKLRGLTLAAAHARLAAAHCTLGAVTHRKSRTPGRVLGQQPAAGGSLSNGAEISVVVGRR